MKRKTLNIIIAVAALWGALSGCRHETAPSFYDTFRRVAHLNLASMELTKMGVIDGETWWKAGQRFGAYSYSTYLTAYIDLEAMRPEDVAVNEKEKEIELRLPPVCVEVDGRDIEMVEEAVHVSGLRSSITPEEVARLKEMINARVLEEVEADNGLRRRLKEQAERRARSFFSELAATRGYGITVKFSDDER